jgi:oxygen-independent coproporphyrinogen-3 oxidase
MEDHSSVPVFLKSLEREMALAGETDQVFDTIYIGGGTPSVLEVESIAHIIESAHRHFTIRDEAEITLEVNPGAISRASFAEYHRSGINRLNIGVQSFNDDNLDFLGRIHSADQATSSIEQARQAGFDNIGIDLIYGLPGQDKEKWLGDLNRTLEADIDHISCYILTCESKTRLGRDVSAGRINMPGDGPVRELFDTTINFLTTHSFQQYEISNYARKKEDGLDPKYSRHNQKYWSFNAYIGLGPSAHSFIAPERYWNHRSIEHYTRQIEAAQLPISDREKLTSQQMIMEGIYLGLRTTRGIDLVRFEKMFGIKLLKTFEGQLGELEKEKYIKLTHTHCALTPKGMAYHDSIAAMLTGQDFS